MVSVCDAINSRNSKPDRMPVVRPRCFAIASALLSIASLWSGAMAR
jgi:hypothetical protein